MRAAPGTDDVCTMDSIFKEDTICAIATPVGEGGIGIVKISGPWASPLARLLFRPSRSVDSFESHRLYYGWIADPRTGETVDEVLLSYMAAPRTYTREDVVEINCHGGYAAIARILELALSSGARLAEPGEFTRRAFLNGRIDLSQAEAVAEIIHSRSLQGILHANRHLRGEFRERVQAWRETLLCLQSRTEAHIDFAEDVDDEPAGTTPDAENLLEEVILAVAAAIEGYRSGRALHEGLAIALAGKPNVGKSSLLNALIGKDRAIVTPFPGTTRDVIEDSFILEGVEVRLLDTAGIRREPDEIESYGIERTIRTVGEADAVLWLIDGSRPLDEEDGEVFRSIGGTRRLILLNKNDLPPEVSPEDVEERFGAERPAIRLSALDPRDVARLKVLLAETFLRQPIETGRSAIVPNLRQKDCLERAMESLERARDHFSTGGFGELASIELAAARRQLEAILGWDGDDELLDRIFSRFCVGK